MPITLLDVDICNQALNILGESPIANLTDLTNDRAVTCALHYPTLKETLLSEFPWTFARKRVRLAALTESPIGYDFQYQLPSESIREAPIAVYLSDETNAPDFKDYRIERDRLLTSQPDIFIEYEFSPPENEWPAYFANLVVYALAERIEEPITAEVDPTRNLSFRVYGKNREIPGGMLSAARRTNRRDTPVEILVDYDILNARSAGSGEGIIHG